MQTAPNYGESFHIRARSKESPILIRRGPLDRRNERSNYSTEPILRMYLGKNTLGFKTVRVIGLLTQMAEYAPLPVSSPVAIG